MRRHPGSFAAMEALERRELLVVHGLVPIFDNGAFFASGGNAAGTAAEAANVNCPDCSGPIGGVGHPVGLPAPLANPGRGPSTFPDTGRGVS